MRISLYVRHQTKDPGAGGSENTNQDKCKKTTARGFHGGSVEKNLPANTRIKIAGRNINNLRNEDGTTLMAESKEELKSLLMKVKEEGEKAGLKLNV